MNKEHCKECGTIYGEPCLCKSPNGSESAETTGYDEIVKIIKDAPITYLPAILMNTVETCVEKSVFVDRETLIEVVEKVVNKTKP